MAKQVLEVEKLSHEHFDQISSDYHQLEFWGNTKTKWIADRAVESLKIQDFQKVADLGGGCGDLLNEICLRKNVKAYCVDSSVNMQTVGKEKHCHNKSLEFVNLQMEDIQKIDLVVDAFIATSTIHFIKEEKLQSFFETIYNKLSKSGKVLILTRREKVPNLPLIATAQKLWCSTPTGTIEAALLNAGFKVTIEEKIYKHALTKPAWYEHFTKRFISTINNDVISDEQIQKEIEELDQTLLKGKDLVEFDDISIFIIGSK
ncbi:hypothetical protein LOD99_7327 [Oopsacas minuta]|uniref:Uncharacterized protein n=1 Tax=Oopsacas minuta TaxID=111878 RepID=A0AAV7JU50_9METZ|nr:hypothetical protein LOD99_7327 [Oopsacas minuta]